MNKITKKAKTYWAGVLRKLVLIQAFPEFLELRTKFWLLFGDLWQFWLAPSTSSYSGISLQTRQDKNINTNTTHIIQHTVDTINDTTEESPNLSLQYLKAEFVGNPNLLGYFSWKSQRSKGRPQDALRKLQRSLCTSLMVPFYCEYLNTDSEKLLYIKVGKSQNASFIFWRWGKNENTFRYSLVRVANVVAHHNKLLTQWRYI